MNFIKYLKKHGLKYSIRIIWQYKIDIVFQKVILLICKNKKLKNIVVIESHNDFDSNGGAFYEYLIRNDYHKKYKLVWLIRNKKPDSLPDNVVCVPVLRPSIAKAYYLINAKYIVTCHEVKGKFRQGQKSYYLTHGPVGLKGFKGNILLPSSLDYCLCPSEYLAPILADQYLLEYPNKKQIILGYPAHDCFYNEEKGDLSKITKQKYEKVILWMPTFRKNYIGTRIDSKKEFKLGIPIFSDLGDLVKLNEKLQERNSLLIIKIHPMQDMQEIKIKTLSNIIVLDGKAVKKLGIDNYRLMKDTDALISDYSSVAYDYLHRNSPIAYTLDDAEEYKLGFIVQNPKELMAGHMIYNSSDFQNFIDEILEGKDLYQKERKMLFDKVFKYHDGKSSQRLADHMGL